MPTKAKTPKKSVRKTVVAKTKKVMPKKANLKKVARHHHEPSRTNNVMLKLLEMKKEHEAAKPHEHENWSGNKPNSFNSSWTGHQGKFHGPRRKAS